MSDYSWDCYRETIFEQEIERLKSLEDSYLPSKHYNSQRKYPVIDYLEARLKEIKEKYKDEDAK